MEKMAFENLSDLTSTFSLKSILSGDPSVFLSISYMVISIAIYSIIIWHFYRFIAQRDCLTIHSISHPKVVGLLKYFFVFPFIAFLFFLGFSLMMLFLTRDYEILAVLSTSFAVIVAIRITAYYSRDLSKDVAKMLPFALLGLFLVNPTYFSLEEIIYKIYLLPEFFNLCIQFIILITLIEWILRIILAVKNAVPNIRAHRLQDKDRKISTISRKQRIVDI
jgi:hypothetical protein